MEELLDQIELNNQPPRFPLLLELRRAEGELEVCGRNDDRKLTDGEGSRGRSLLRVVLLPDSACPWNV